MKYTGPASPNLSSDDLAHIMRCLLADSDARSVELRNRIRTHLDALDFARTVNTSAEAHAWTPPSLKPSA